MSVHFEQETAVRALGSGLYATAFSQDWFVFAGPNGGIVAAVLLAAWLTWKTPPELTQRFFAAASVVLVYVIVRRLVSRTLEEYLPKELR